MLKRITFKYTFLFLMLLYGAIAAYSQHSGVVSQYMFNGLVLNPAYAGSQSTLAVNINYRNQWTGFEGAPKAQIASVHSPLKDQPISIGGIVSHEEAGLSSDIRVSAVGSYKLKLETGELQFGIGAGLGIISSRWQDALIDNIDDPLFQQNTVGLVRPLFSTGVYYQDRNWYAGYSLPSILSYDYSGGEEIRTTFSVGGMEHMLTAGYVYKINRRVVIKPSMLIRVQPSSVMTFDLNTNVVFKKKIWTGISYRHSDALVALLEYQIHHQLRLGYSYDYTLNAIGNYSAGSHEIALMWAFRKKSFARNPRYF
ncbi:MAG: type IX secretion system membrane protein PorP/SprF [Flavobacteriales bacterium]|nr:type IX secretion system membrane protein PorP/SprF [Flavobacteriales bacterium]